MNERPMTTIYMPVIEFQSDLTRKEFVYRREFEFEGPPLLLEGESFQNPYQFQWLFDVVVDRGCHVTSPLISHRPWNTHYHLTKFGWSLVPEIPYAEVTR